MKKYIDVDFNYGMTIEEAVKYLRQLSYETGKDYWGTFNGNILSSDMTVDEAYIKCIGKDEREKMRQDFIRREEEHKKENSRTNKILD